MSIRQIVKFGAFELDARAGELRKNGRKLKLRDQPLRVLTILLESPGEAVTREELQERLWPGDTFVDFDNSLNTAIARLRVVLGDSATRPRFIETIPRRGYRFIADVDSEPETPGDPLINAREEAPDTSTGVGRQKRVTWALITACLAMVFIGSVYLRPEATSANPVRKWSFAPEGLMSGYRAAVISPNGRHIAYRSDHGQGGPALWVRDLDSLTARRLDGTEGVAQGYFWSPDSKFLAFAVGTEFLKKIAVDGGPPITICKLSGAFHAGSWSPDGESLIFSMRLQVHEVSASGGEPRVLFERVDTGRGPANRLPILLPVENGARNVVFSAGGSPADLVLMNLDTGRRSVLTAGALPSYAPSGHIVFTRSDGSRLDLWALPFSLDKMQPTGEPFPIAENATDGSVSGDGSLVFVRPRQKPLERLVWRDRNGTGLGEIGQPQRGIGTPALSPDGKLVAVSAGEGNLDIWLHDVDRPARRRLTSHQSVDWQPVWSPSGDEIVHLSKRGGGFGIYRRSLEDGGESELLLEKPTAIEPYGWSPGGSRLFYAARAVPHYDLWYLERNEGSGGFTPVPLLETPYNEIAPSLSPDGGFLAYCSDQSGAQEVWVREFPTGGGQWQVSTDGGCQPRWSHDGDEILYVAGNTLMAARIEKSPKFSVSSTAPLFSDPKLSTRQVYLRYDVSADGRFVLVEDVADDTAEPPSVNVVENWYEEFRDRP